MTVRYPAGDVTPAGWWHIVNDTRPLMRLKAYDGSIDTFLLGGLAPPYNDPTLPEAAVVKSLKGLIPPWQHIDQKGATEDGITNIDNLYDPTEVEMVVECVGRNPKYLRRVYRDLIGSIDAKQQSELGFFSQDLGYWWAPIRWFKGAPPDPLTFSKFTRQQLSLRLRADDGFWRTYNNTDMFRFTYESMVETFSTDYSGSSNLGPNWPQYYSGTGGYCSTVAGYGAAWYPSGLAQREVVNGPFKDFSTATDDQVVEMTLSIIPELIFLGGAYNDLWGRMGRNMDGTWDGNGIRARIGRQGTIFGYVELTRFNTFTPTVMYWLPLLIPPLIGETFSLVCGYDPDNPRTYRILRNGLPVLSHVEVGTASNVGSTFRGVGFGMLAGAGLLRQATPSWVSQINAGDNSTVAQSGFLTRTNVGDQPMSDEYTVFGPGTFSFWNGPGAGTNDFVQFGPLLPNQVVQVRTDTGRRGGKRTVQDLTSVPATPQELNLFQDALELLESFAFGNNVAPLLQTINSIFGIQPPQGNLYSLLKGRFSDAAAIPPKSPGNPAQPYYVKVSIADGNADSKVIVSGTPLRRLPL